MFHVDIILFSLCSVNLNKCELTTKTCFENNPLILCEPIFKGTSVYWRSHKYALCLCSNIIRGPLSCRLIHLHLIIMVLPSFISLLNLLIVFSLATVLIMGNSLPDRQNIFLLVRCIQFYSLQPVCSKVCIRLILNFLSKDKRAWNSGFVGGMGKRGDSTWRQD